MLMAAALLISTSTWAAYQVGGQTKSTLQQAIDAANDGDEITVIPTGGGLTPNTQVVLNADKHIKLNLNGNTIEFTYNPAAANKDAALIIRQGILEIKGTGSITTDQAGAYDLIRLYGVSDEIDAATQTPHSQVIIGENVTITNSKNNALTITQNTDKLANGARIDVYSKGEAKVYGEKYGIKVNGDVHKPANANHSAYVYIHAAANLEANSSAKKAVAAYSSGYARWRIEGNCTGSTGLYAKSGDVVITGDAHISSNNDDEVTTQTGKSSGVEAGGSAIVIESNANYQGNISVTISGNATITGNSGYAIEETIDDAVEGTMVSSISIQGGTIEGGDAGAVIIEEETDQGDKVTVVGGTIEGNVTTGTTVVSGVDAMTNFLPGGNNDDNAFVVVVTSEGEGDDKTYTYTVTPDKTKVVNTNNYGWSTFSFVPASEGESRKVPTGVTAYVAKYVSGDALTLTPLEGEIPANTGVLLYGPANEVYTLSGATPWAPATIAENTNQLVAASEWGGTLDALNGIYTNVAKDNVYVLSGNELLKYTGNQMKANKAYLQLPAAGPYGAPKRVKLVVAETEETQAVDNVETTIEAVKFMENGQIYIRRGENIYNVQGQIVK